MHGDGGSALWSLPGAILCAISLQLKVRRGLGESVVEASFLPPPTQRGSYLVSVVLTNLLRFFPRRLLAEPSLRLA